MPLTFDYLVNCMISLFFLQTGVPLVLDGDMLSQFLELTNIQQEAVLGLPCDTAEVSSSSRSLHSNASVNQVVQLLERFHNVLN